MSAYSQLEARFARYFHLRGAAGILHWDAATMMPEGSSQMRAAQLEALTETTHALITDDMLAPLLNEAEEDISLLNDWQAANLREMRHLWRHENALDAKLSAALTRHAVESEMRWRQARRENDFAGFAPQLQTMLELTREAAAAKAHALGLCPYDALLDQFDPGMRQAIIDPIFTDLATFLPGFTGEAIARQEAAPPPLPLEGPFPAEAQRALGRQFMALLGFDFTQGRLDDSAHPFCGGAPGDVRLTSRYSEGDFLQGFFGVLHETGHALYEMGLPEAWRGQPVGEARGMSLHESQSLSIEMQLSRSLDFLTFAAPLIRAALGGEGPEWEAENLHRLVTQVRPGLIRVHADEVTYPSHILLRYRLEKALLSGDLPVTDLPAAWAEGMQEFLGIVPDTDSDGCLQDIHWPEGMFGYFPTYTLGAMAAAQLMEAARAALPGLAETVRRGEFAALTGWLREHLHSLGSKYFTPELLQKATGRELDVEAYKAHLKRRYLDHQ